MTAEGAAAGPPPGHELMRRSTFEAVAAALRQRLGLTLFGFDIVFDSSAGVWRGLGCVFAKRVSPAGLLLAACASTSSAFAGGAQLASAPVRNLTPPPGAAAPAYPRPAAGELVIVDVNYFPSFKGIPEAPTALQAALWERYQSAHQQQ